MSDSENDPVLLLAAPHPVRAELARDLLRGAGIPCLLQGQDRDFAELGAAAHMGVSRPDLYVPQGARARACALLREAWGEGWERDAACAPDEDAAG